MPIDNLMADWGGRFDREVTAALPIEPSAQLEDGAVGLDLQGHMQR